MPKNNDRQNNGNPAANEERLTEHAEKKTLHRQCDKLEI